MRVFWRQRGEELNETARVVPCGLVGVDLHFVAFACQGGRDSHSACVGIEDVETIGLGMDLLCGGLDGGEGCEVAILRR